jgi:serine/threonine protein kinase
MGQGPTPDWTWINAAADRFERAWKTGPRPRIEDFLAELAEPRREAILDELLRVELELRRRANHEPGPEEYRKRFPNDHAVIDAVFATNPDRSGNSGRALPSTTAGGAGARSPANSIPQELAENPDYQIIRKLGGGGMGLVFLAHNHILGRDEVLKVISREIIETPGVLERFLREIRAVASLQHPNIVTAYTAFRAGESLVFAMEYAEGLDLARMVKAKGPLPVGHACSFVHQAAMGLQHAHEAGMVHRDIKPDNLMLTSEGGRAIIKILDFGLAKATSEQIAAGPEVRGSSQAVDGEASLTRTGWMLGTPDFVAPEQIKDAQKADIRADIYSLGCSLYYLLAGRPPFQEPTLYDVLKAHRSTDAQPLNLIRPDVPSGLADLVAKMMSKRPDRRLQTPAEVAKALAPFFKKRSMEIAGRDPNASPPGSGLASRPATEHRTDSTPSPPGTDPKHQAARAESAWPNLIEIKETLAEDEVAEVTTEAPAGHKQTRWRQAALAGVLGLLAVLCSGVVIYKWLANDRRGPLPLAASALDPKTTEPAPLPGADASGLALDAVRLASSADQSGPPSTDSAPNERNEPTRAAPEVAKTETAAPAPKSLPPDTAGRGPVASTEPRPSAFEEQIERAIRHGIRFLKSNQRDVGSWPDIEMDARTGTTSLVTLALLTAGEQPDSPAIRKALDHLRGFRADQLNSTYAIALQTMVFAAAVPEQDRSRIAANVNWLERAQIRRGDPCPWPGTWTYGSTRKHPGDSSNTQYALLALSAAREIGARVKPEVWALARSYWEDSRKQDGSWAYTPSSTGPSTPSITCAGISSLILTRRWTPPFRGQELMNGRAIRDCGKDRVDRTVQGGIDWLSNHFDVEQNSGFGKQWRFYYLYGLARAGRLAGVRFFGQNDWFRLGAEALLREQDKLAGCWTGTLVEADKTLATSFAILFLAKGRAPVLINKLKHAPGDDWNNDNDDVGNLVDLVSRERKRALSWQIVDSRTATVADLLRAPILFLSGHKAPEFTPSETMTLEEYVKRGGTIVAEACCDHLDFDRGFRAMLKAMFPDKESELRALPEDHPVWRAKHQLDPGTHPLWGIQQGGRTSIIYSPRDLSCYWNQAGRDPSNPNVIKAINVGQNLVEFALDRQPVDSAR